MYTCKDSINLLLAFVDGELPREEEQHLHEHLGDCTACVNFLAKYRATPDLCRKVLAEKMPAEFSRKLKDFLRAKCKPQP